MGARTMDEKPPARAVEHVNEVRLVVTRAGEVGRSRQKVDALECAVWAPRVRRSVKRWQLGDVVEVTGSVRRRFFRAGGGAASRVEIEVGGGKVIRRAGSG